MKKFSRFQGQQMLLIIIYTMMYFLMMVIISNFVLILKIYAMLLILVNHVDLNDFDWFKLSFYGFSDGGIH